MKTNNQNWGSSNQPRKTGKQQQVNNPGQNKNVDTEKKGVYVKDMPPIDGAKPGVV
ncbi:hypothetical protein [Mucilaginibacter sp. dw_454]|uniref:hypothetical protein n=1 Tax=Mucilaginibacter sp. dw_454 TaxID=2720079 RepID=UPI001BD6AD02|nr:hypothetical protein [Mucilaginibacter sp. dw_454]